MHLEPEGVEWHHAVYIRSFYGNSSKANGDKIDWKGQNKIIFTSNTDIVKIVDKSTAATVAWNSKWQWVEGWLGDLIESTCIDPMGSVLKCITPPKFNIAPEILPSQ